MTKKKKVPRHKDERMSYKKEVNRENNKGQRYEVQLSYQSTH